MERYHAAHLLAFLFEVYYMLNAMREGAKSGVMRFVLFGLMSLAVFGLVLTDAGGFFGGGFDRQTIATIGDIDLTLPVFNNTYSRELDRSNIPPETARSYGVPQMVLSREINRLSLLQAAYDSDLRVGDVFVAQSIKRQLDEVGLKGNDAENLDYVLRQMNMSEAQLTRGTREDATTTLIASVTANTGKALRPAIEALYRYEKEKRVAEIITISPSDITDIENVTEGDIDVYYQANQARFTTPENRSITMLHVTTDSIGRDITIDETMIADFYESNKAEYHTPDQYRFAQAIVATSDEAQTIATQATAEGIDALKMAEQFMDADWYAVENLPAELSAAVKMAKAGDIVGPVETSLGHHVLKVIDVKKDVYMPLADVQTDIKAILRDKEVDSQIYGLADDLDNAVADGLSLSELAQQYDITLKSIDNLQSNTTEHASFPQNQNDVLEIIETTFVIEEEEISPVIEFGDGSFALVEVTKITAQEIQPLAKVSQEIKTQLNEQKKYTGVQSKAAKIMGAFNKGEGSMAALAKQHNVSFAQPRAILRSPQGGVSISTDEAGLLFSLTPKNDISSLRVGKDVKIIRLSDIKGTSVVPTSGAEIDGLTQKVAADINGEMQVQFINAWKEKLGVNINMELFQQAFLTAPNDDQ